ncbi:hypothetical protein J5837_06040 [Pseudoxanthomonas helianthi]|uniref:Uncharacterized protein n=1 Tax=Pseudoxanthomonas helianthi TaxID=1453541 RepID=A0A941ATB6_9GAMM|nr:hypothetical protein [Pseudoxanthomonas helianthi]MBP3983985.1 hypothetical protein [Pseudoxanthomonas helianthi]
MPLYHATLRAYSSGQEVVATVPTTFYPEAVTEIEKFRGTHQPNRSFCLFATDDLDFCYYFALRQRFDPEKINIYEVQMALYHKAPIAIVHTLQRRIEKGESLGRLPDEYWNPTVAWKFWEYFGSAMTIVGEVQKPQIDQTLIFIKYQGESKLASSL